MHKSQEDKKVKGGSYRCALTAITFLFSFKLIECNRYFTLAPKQAGTIHSYKILIEEDKNKKAHHIRSNMDSLISHIP